MTYGLRSWQPVEPRRNGIWQNAVAVTLIGVLAGTGGNVSPAQIIKQFGTGSASRAVHDSQVAATDQGFVVELKSIREALRLSVAETAQLFGVSRPTIYSWQNGNSISPDNAERLCAIANAIAPRLHLLEAQVGRVAHRAIEGRTTLLQKLAEGANADHAIGQLSDILIREATQRERLARRLQARIGNRGAVDLDLLG
ncbi:MAG: XRE family transcriptional regulator [Gammaproteobacteria bacterium]|nr:MAG: XRE family transcriptional regulator [Gammaproteobacteria bacterium]